VGKVGLVRFGAVHLPVGIRSFVWVRQQLNNRGRKWERGERGKYPSMALS
jgi:hypothetical protein